MEKITTGGFNMSELENNVNVEEEVYITLTFDDGTEENCMVIGIFEADDKEYIALAPNDEEAYPYLFKYNEVGEEEIELLDIEDDAEYAKVQETFEALMAEDEE